MGGIGQAVVDLEVAVGKFAGHETKPPLYQIAGDPRRTR
jgi:hypothetical protein